jgi:hypothetical protein
VTASPSARTQRAVALGCALAALSLGGCGGPSFQRAPHASVDLGGHWILDPAASSDAAAMIAAALPKPRTPSELARDNYNATMQGASGMPGGNGGQRNGRGDGSNLAPSPVPNLPPSWGRNTARDFVTAFALPAARIEIAAQPTLVTLTQGDRRRTFEPGDEEPFSVTDRFGSRKVRAGWDGESFVVRSEDGARLRILEQFRRLPNDRLGTEIEFSARGIKSLKIRSVYRRATNAELAAPPPEGPPTPGPH